MTVEGKEEDSFGRSCVAELRASVSLKVLSLQTVTHQLSFKEHKLSGSCFFNNLSVYSRSPVHLVGLTVGRINVDVLAIVPAVPVFVLFKTHMLVCLVVGHLVRTVGRSGGNAGVVGRSPNTVGFGKVSLVKVFLNQPVRSKVVVKVEALEGLSQY